MAKEEKRVLTLDKYEHGVVINALNEMRNALLFIRGEMPIMDEKYDLLNHPNVRFTPEKGGAPYVHGGTELSVGSMSLSTVSGKETRFINLSETEFELLSDEEIEGRRMLTWNFGMKGGDL